MFEGLLDKLRRYVSPIFLALLVASFVLWYIAKLNYTYTTEQEIRVNVDGEKFDVECVVEGVGTNLFGYNVYMSKRLSIPLSELNYRIARAEEGENGISKQMIIIEPMSLQSAISVRFSDIKVISVGTIPEIPLPEEK